MEKSSKRGKIPQSDWPLIMSRYEAGETLASIARTYGCSPPAISYVVSRSRARQTAASPQAKRPTGGEAHLVKAEAAPGAARPAINGVAAPGDGPGAAPAAFGGGERQVRPSPSAAPRPPVPAGQAEGDQRRTLRLSLGNGGANAGEPPAAGQHDGPHAPPPQPAGGRGLPPQRPQFFTDMPERGRDRAASGFAETRAEPLRHGEAEAAPRRDGGPFIDKELRARVDGDIAAFLAAFDAALAGDTPESRSALREATDRLLRAGARTRIELERLEARVPLPRRDDSRRDGEPVWRHR
jgi:hypothetical protein